MISNYIIQSNMFYLQNSIPVAKLNLFDLDYKSTLQGELIA